MKKFIIIIFIEDEILEKDDSEQEKEINLLNNMLNMLRDYNYKINIINQGSNKY